MKKIIQKIFGLRTDVSLNFYLNGFVHKYILRRNIDVPWMVHPTSTVFEASKITRGKNVYPGDSPGNFIDGTNGVFIGDYTNLGPNVGIISTNHNLIDNSKTEASPPIRIGRFCWIGMNAVILPGVELGDFTIVGAGAIVSKSFPEGYCVLGGVPAQIINYLDKDACKQFSQTKYNS